MRWWTRSPHALYSGPWIYIESKGSLIGYKSSIADVLDISPCVVIA